MPVSNVAVTDDEEGRTFTITTSEDGADQILHALVLGSFYRFEETDELIQQLRDVLYPEEARVLYPKEIDD